MLADVAAIEHQPIDIIWGALFLTINYPFVVVIGLILFYAFMNGFNDSGGLVAAAISSRSLNPRSAFVLAAVAEFTGPFLFGTAVAATIGTGLIETRAITLTVLLLAMVSANVWNLFTSYFGIPSSSTHALLGGLIGAVIMTHGYDALIVTGFVKVLFALFSAPLLGIVMGFGVMRLAKFMASGASPRVNDLFKRTQVLNVIALAMSHGTNDGQKSMALMAMALFAAAKQTDFGVPWWAMLLVATSLTLGVSTGGWRIIRTLGAGIYRLRPVHAFAAQSGSAIVVLGAALLGGPVSTTQVVSSAIMGVGSAERIRAVRWQVARQIAIAWLITIPASALVAMLLDAAMRMGWMAWNGH